MDPTTSALLGTLIGAATALVGAAATLLVSLHNERRRREEAEHAAFVQSLRSTAATVFAEFYNFSHAISWVTWYARFAPDAVGEEMLRGYERDSHTVIPKLQGALAMVASLSLPAFQQLQPLVTELFVLDKHVSLAIGQYANDPAETLTTLAGLLDEVNAVQDKLPQELHQIMQNVQSKLNR